MFTADTWALDDKEQVSRQKAQKRQLLESEETDEIEDILQGWHLRASHKPPIGEIDALVADWHKEKDVSRGSAPNKRKKQMARTARRRRMSPQLSSSPTAHAWVSLTGAGRGVVGQRTLEEHLEIARRCGLRHKTVSGAPLTFF